jgi:hypothetical protein
MRRHRFLAPKRRVHALWLEGALYLFSAASKQLPMTVAVGKASRVSKARRVDKTGLATHTDVMHFPVTSRLNGEMMPWTRALGRRAIAQCGI